LEALIMLADMISIGILSFYIIKGIFGDGPLGRIFGVLGCIVCAFLYGSLVGWANYNVESMFWGSVIFFGPFGLLLLLVLLGYAFGGEKANE